MTVMDTAITYTAAWLAVGLALFIATGSFRALRPIPLGTGAEATRRRWRPAQALYLVPLLLALGMLAVGLANVVRVVPW